MKKILVIIIAVFLTVCLFSGQPESCNIKIDDGDYDVYFKNNYLYYKKGIFYYKLFEEKILSYKIYDIDFDKNDELLVITKEQNNQYGNDLVIFDTDFTDRLQIMEIFRQDFSEVRPWKIDACDLDNNGETDIYVGVYKDTTFYKDVRKRPFFYSWDGQRLNKKWLGSFFTDWELVDISFGDYFGTGYDLAAVLEKNETGEYRIGIYNFVGFGFEHMKTFNIDYADDMKIDEIINDKLQSY